MHVESISIAALNGPPILQHKSIHSCTNVSGRQSYRLGNAIVQRNALRLDGSFSLLLIFRIFPKIQSVVYIKGNACKKKDFIFFQRLLTFEDAPAPMPIAITVDFGEISQEAFGSNIAFGMNA